MNRQVLICFVMSTLGAVAIATGCGDDDKGSGTPSGKGESCTHTADCKSGLLCIQGSCAAGPSTGSHPDAGESPPSSGAGGSGNTGAGGAITTPAPVLGGEGESCTRRADCQTGLACVLQACTASGMTGGGDTDGGSTPTPLPTLGQRGESCQSVRDCADGLTCIPRPGVAGGICDVEKYGLTPTGKTCDGECKTAKDCCELPEQVIVPDPTTMTFTPITSCADLVDLLDGDPTVCDAATPPPAKDPACFYYKAYCDCAANTWACTNNSCQYTAKCAHDGAVSKGCPARTRTGAATSATTCNTMTDKCEPVVTGCSTPDDCVGNPVYDDAVDACTKDECTCVEKHCYRKCDEDLDCPAKYACDTKQKVCTPQTACTDNAHCAVTLMDVRAECQSGKCVVPCVSDHDCSPSGAVTGGGAFNARVCNKDGVCEALGCMSDDECQTPGGVREFCVDPGTMSAAALKSAVTD
jgi:hypothetical protein